MEQKLNELDAIAWLLAARHDDTIKEASEFARAQAMVDADDELKALYEQETLVAEANKEKRIAVSNANADAYKGEAEAPPLRLHLVRPPDCSAWGGEPPHEPRLRLRHAID